MIISFKQSIELLELSAQFSQEDLKRQYRRLAHRHHPDKGGDPEKFKQVKSAYEFLSGRNPLPEPQGFPVGYQGFTIHVNYGTNGYTINF